MSTANTNNQLTTRTAIFQTSEDLKTAFLIVSASINLFIFTGWLLIQTDPTLALVLVRS